MSTTSWPARTSSSATSGLRSIAFPTPQTVHCIANITNVSNLDLATHISERKQLTFTFKSSKIRRIRRTPARAPYSNSDSIEGSRAFLDVRPLISPR